MKCPKCGEELKEVENIHYCTNKKCKGWYCFRCDKWHPFGTSCAYADIDGYNINDQHSYDEWCKEHKEDLFHMLLDSFIQEYPKDEQEEEGDYFKKELEEMEDKV